MGHECGTCMPELRLRTDRIWEAGGRRQKRVSSPLVYAGQTPAVPWAGPFLSGTGRGAGEGQRGVGGVVRSLSRLGPDLEYISLKAAA